MSSDSSIIFKCSCCLKCSLTPSNDYLEFIETILPAKFDGLSTSRQKQILKEVTLCWLSQVDGDAVYVISDSCLYPFVSSLEEQYGILGCDTSDHKLMEPTSLTIPDNPSYRQCGLISLLIASNILLST